MFIQNYVYINVTAVMMVLYLASHKSTHCNRLRKEKNSYRGNLNFRQKRWRQGKGTPKILT